jgi:hypothetical protein
MALSSVAAPVRDSRSRVEGLGLFHDMFVIGPDLDGCRTECYLENRNSGLSGCISDGLVYPFWNFSLKHDARGALDNIVVVYPFGIPTLV